jgi:hypothetical protein
LKKIVIALGLLVTALGITVAAATAATSAQAGAAVTADSSSFGVGYQAPLPPPGAGGVQPDTGVVPANTYTYINYPTNLLDEEKWELTPNSIPQSQYFWSQQFEFSGSCGTGCVGAPGAYVGLQGINKMVFSVFGVASPEQSTGCTTVTNNFDGISGESGTQCLFSYTVTQGDTYLFTLQWVSTDSNGYNWLATVKNVTTSVTTTIGEINTPTSWGILNGTPGANGTGPAFSEYFGSQLAACPTTTQTEVSWADFSADEFFGSSNPELPSSSADFVQSNSCQAHSEVVNWGSYVFTHLIGD